MSILDAKIIENIQPDGEASVSPLRIGIVGPESTGKTFLASRLSSHYKSMWVEEYARTYVGVLARSYTYADVEAIARWQIEKELDLMHLPPHYPFVFFDTELIITKVWFLHVYGQCPAFVEEHLNRYPMDFYLLCAPDLPWEPDPLRENPTIRDYLFAWYEKEIVNLHTPYAIVNGVGDERTMNACRHLDTFLKKRNQIK